MTNNLTAGPELDAAVARAVGDASVTHNWEGQGSNHYGTAYLCLKCGEVELTDDIEYDGRGGCIRPYSTDLNAAFEAAEKVRLFHYRAMFYCPHSGWHLVKCDELDCLGRGSRGPLTPALAICNAILALHGDK